MTSDYIQTLSFEPLDPHEEGVVALTIHYEDPVTGYRWQEYYPRIRIEDHGVGEDGNHKYTFSTALSPVQQEMRDRYFGKGL